LRSWGKHYRKVKTTLRKREEKREGVWREQGKGGNIRFQQRDREEKLVGILEGMGNKKKKNAKGGQITD